MTAKFEPSNQLIFLHGFLGCKEDWDPVIAQLKNQYSCVALDLPGHGETDLAVDLRKTLRNQNLENVPIIGYSMGGRIALSLELSSPLILLAAHPGLSTQKERQARLDQDLNIAAKLRTLPFEAFLDWWYSQPLFAGLKEKRPIYKEMLNRRLKGDPDLLAGALERFSLGNQKMVTYFPTPCFYLYGKDDLKFAAISHTLPSTITIKPIGGCGHAMHLENPIRVANAIRECLQSMETER